MKKIIFFSLALIFILEAPLGVYLAVNDVSSAQQTQALTVNENKAVQQKLKELGYYSGSVDGVYGQGTRNAVIAFQKANGLTADGVVGQNTARALGISLNTQQVAQSSSDLYLLAKTVYAEARGEPYEGQVAVAAVILNRVGSPDFPNTIAEVVYQPWAFTAVHDGQINLEPNETAYSAARDAMNGWAPTYGSRTTVVTIGKHVFAI